MSIMERWKNRVANWFQKRMVSELESEQSRLEHELEMIQRESGDSRQAGEIEGHITEIKDLIAESKK